MPVETRNSGRLEARPAISRLPDFVSVHAVKIKLRFISQPIVRLLPTGSHRHRALHLLASHRARRQASGCGSESCVRSPRQIADSLGKT